ncbi:hypothetical protein QBC38DRAFT_461440 [Podospora fimiseda]|uniref:Uncharacterized protein n=1 Tax=Podospora fimiseda TaxID=252190 RepID=A0AAN6YRJ6_9PEZI|nr:hypothetical protein QBC38DRAFT_461440 [Podospora fimiseda]
MSQPTPQTTTPHVAWFTRRRRVLDAIREVADEMRDEAFVEKQINQIEQASKLLQASQAGNEQHGVLKAARRWRLQVYQEYRVNWTDGERSMTHLAYNQRYSLVPFLCVPVSSMPESRRNPVVPSSNRQSKIAAAPAVTSNQSKELVGGSHTFSLYTTASIIPMKRSFFDSPPPGVRNLLMRSISPENFQAPFTIPETSTTVPTGHIDQPSVTGPAPQTLDQVKSVSEPLQRVSTSLAPSPDFIANIEERTKLLFENVWPTEDPMVWQELVWEAEYAQQAGTEKPFVLYLYQDCSDLITVDSLRRICELVEGYYAIDMSITSITVGYNSLSLEFTRLGRPSTMLKFKMFLDIWNWIQDWNASRGGTELDEGPILLCEYIEKRQREAFIASFPSQGKDKTADGN